MKGCLIEAVPGSGKTKQIENLINNKIIEGVDPLTIFAITFTREASYVLKDRISNDKVHCSTIHSLARLLSTYHDSEYYASSFDEMLIDATDLLINNLVIPNISILCVDEIQDINELQYKFIAELCKKAEYIFLVGDKNQSIYQFQGSSYEYMYKLSKEFSLEVIQNNLSYRLPKSVSRYMNHVFNYDPLLKSKDSASQGRVISALGEKGNRISVESKQLYDSLINDMSEDENLVLLFRTNKEVETAINNLSEKYISYVLDIRKHPYYCMFNVVKSIYKYHINKNTTVDFDDLIITLAFIGYAGNYNMQNMINTRNSVLRYSGESRIKLNKIYESFDLDYSKENNIINSFSNIEIKILKDTFELLDSISFDETTTLSGFVRICINDLSLEVSKDMNINVEELEEYVSIYEQEGDPYFIINKDARISVMTVHAAKGREFDNVIYTLNRKVVKSDPNEKYVWFVALSRAIKTLILYSPYFEAKEDNNEERIYQRMFTQPGIV